MEIISHRRNTIDDLTATPVSYGVEVDIRSQGDRLIIHHDPFVDGQDFGDWADNYRHGTLILNVKEEGLEDRLVVEMDRRGIENFFFLDQSFPFLVRSARAGERRCAVRVSEFEDIETALSLSGQIDWVWVDCFSRFPLNRSEFVKLKDAGFRLCLVSPELQGRDSVDELSDMHRFLAEQRIEMDAVCTKTPQHWE